MNAASAPMRGDVAQEQFNTEEYDHISENDFIAVADQPLSTFSIDVDTASYSNVRRFLNQGELPPVGAVRIEELINYFSYDYPGPSDDHPFAVVHEVSESPWSAGNLIVHIGLQGKRMAQKDIPPRNLVFLLDVSGSMNDHNKLPLLKSSLKMLVESMDERDRVAIVVYAGAAGAVLEPTSASNQNEILSALDRLEAGGSTNGGQGIELAYALAEQNLDPKAINRVILATDGDFNVGTTDQSSLIRLVEKKRETGVFLTVLGFGMGNYKDSTMEKLADKGNGNYAYIDTLNEARKVLVNEAGSTLFTIAKDVKIQVEFNPAEVVEYRLIGYENRLLDNQDFNDDTKDAGEIGAGHSVTALYEIVPAGSTSSNASGSVDPLKYQTKGAKTAAAATGEMMTVKLRYKQPEAEESQLLSVAVGRTVVELANSSDDFRFSTAVAGFGMMLRDSKHRGALTWATIADLGSGAMGKDAHGYRKEFMELVARAADLSPKSAAVAK